MKKKDEKSAEIATNERPEKRTNKRVINQKDVKQKQKK